MESIHAPDLDGKEEKEMLKKRLLIGTTIVTVATGTLVGNLMLGPAFARPQPPSTPTAAQCAVQSADDNSAEAALKGPDMDAVEEEVGNQYTNADAQAQKPSYCGSTLVDESQYDGLSEADEGTALEPKATISSDEAKAIVEAANPGAIVIKTELDNENGVLVYSVELSNGTEVKVDAGTGNVLYTEGDDPDSGGEVDGQED
jgi:uncharacterized membrane protein YkoI